MLVVAINSDRSLLSAGRESVQSEHHRGRVIEAILESHERRMPHKWRWYVTWFDEPTPIKLIEVLRPDVLVKGGDYAGQEIVGAEFVKSYGGRVVFTPFVEGLSATRLLAEEAHEKSPAGLG